MIIIVFLFLYLSKTEYEFYSEYTKRVSNQTFSLLKQKIVFIFI